MPKIFTLISLCISSFVWGQNHAENLETINTLEAAEDYASGFDEVFTGTVNIEKDIFFFDDIDTSNLESHVGTSKSFFGKTTKLLSDSIFNIVNVQVIRFDLKKIAPETAEILVGQMKKMLERGDSYWDLKEKFSHTSAEFSSKPEIMEEVLKEYQLSEAEMIEDAYYQWSNEGQSIGFLIVDEEPHKVPGFCTISFLNLNNGKVR